MTQEQYNLLESNYLQYIKVGSTMYSTANSTFDNTTGRLVLEIGRNMYELGSEVIPATYQKSGEMLDTIFVESANLFVLKTFDYAFADFIIAKILKQHGTL